MTEWKWPGGDNPSVLLSIVEYSDSVPSETRSQYEELEKWIEDGWLVLHTEYKHGPAKKLIPLMAVVQHKGKVRHILNFRELNTYIDTYTANSDVCGDRMKVHD